MLGDLTYEDILAISKRIVEKIDLLELAMMLGLSWNEVNLSLRNDEATITETSYDILQKWLFMQPNRQEAYIIMNAALRHCQLNLIAAELLRDDPGRPAVVSRTHGI